MSKTVKTQNISRFPTHFFDKDFEAIDRWVVLLHDYAKGRGSKHFEIEPDKHVIVDMHLIAKFSVDCDMPIKALIKLFNHHIGDLESGYRPWFTFDKEIGELTVILFPYYKVTSLHNYLEKQK